MDRAEVARNGVAKRVQHGDGHREGTARRGIGVRGDRLELACRGGLNDYRPLGAGNAGFVRIPSGDGLRASCLQRGREKRTLLVRRDQMLTPVPIDLA